MQQEQQKGVIQTDSRGRVYMDGKKLNGVNTQMVMSLQQQNVDALLRVVRLQRRVIWWTWAIVLVLAGVVVVLVRR